MTPRSAMGGVPSPGAATASNEAADRLGGELSPPPAPRPVAPSPAERAYVGTLHAIAAILAMRFLLLLAVIGTFTLAALSISAPSTPAIILVSVFGALTIGPLTVLHTRTGGR